MKGGAKVKEVDLYSAFIAYLVVMAGKDRRRMCWTRANLWLCAGHPRGDLYEL